MQTFIVRREATDIATDNSYNALGKLGDPWPVQRPLNVMHSHYGEGIDLTITTHYPDGIIPVEELETGAMFRITIERVDEVTTGAAAR